MLHHTFAPLPPLGRVGEPWWDDKPTAIVGCGPSLKGFDLNRLNIAGVRVIAVNEAIWDLPFAEAVFSLDRPYINKRGPDFSPLPMQKFFAVEPEYGPCAVVDGASYFLRSRFDGYSDDPSIIQSGANSGFGATQLAYLKRGPARAHWWHWVLFGFDYLDHPDVHYNHARYQAIDKVWAASPRHNGNYWRNWGDCFLGCRAQLDLAKIRVINASPITTVRAFDKCSVDEGVWHLLARAAEYRRRT